VLQLPRDMRGWDAILPACGCRLAVIVAILLGSSRLQVFNRYRACADVMASLALRQTTGERNVPLAISQHCSRGTAAQVEQGTDNDWTVYPRISRVDEETSESILFSCWFLSGAGHRLPFQNETGDS